MISRQAQAISHELACSVTDVLARLRRIAWSRCQGLDGLPVVTDVWQRYGGVTREHVEQQVADYRSFLADGFTFRARAEP